MGAIATYVAVPVDGNDVKAAIKESERIALERIGNEPGEMQVVSRETVIVGRMPIVTGQDDEGNDVTRDQLMLEVRATYRKEWEDEPNAPEDPR